MPLTATSVAFRPEMDRRLDGLSPAYRMRGHGFPTYAIAIGNSGGGGRDLAVAAGKAGKLAIFPVITRYSFIAGVGG